MARGSIVGALLVFLRRELPFRRRDREFIVRAFDYDAAVGLAEPFEIKRSLRDVRGGFSLRFDIAYACSTRNRENARFGEAVIAATPLLAEGEMRMGERSQVVMLSGNLRDRVTIAFAIRSSAAFNPDFTVGHSFGAFDLTATTYRESNAISANMQSGVRERRGLPVSSADGSASPAESVAASPVMFSRDALAAP